MNRQAYNRYILNKIECYLFKKIIIRFIIELVIINKSIVK